MNNALKTWLEFLYAGYYYFSVCASALIAFILINYLYKVIKRSDRERGKLRLTASRIKKQLFLGLGAGVLLAGILYGLHGQNIFTNCFFDQLFAAIVLFLILISVCYCFYFFYIWQKGIANQVVIVETVKTEVRYKILAPQEVSVNVPIGLPYVIYLVNKVPMAYGGDGNMMTWDLNITDSMKILSVSDYFQISKQIIINRAMVKGLKNYNEKHVLIIPVFPIPIKLISSRRRTTPFKEWLSN